MTNEKLKFEKATLYATMPFILAVPPIIGWLIGGWLDKLLGSPPWLMLMFIFIGFAAGCRELYRVIKKYGDT